MYERTANILIVYCPAILIALSIIQSSIQLITRFTWYSYHFVQSISSIRSMGYRPRLGFSAFLANYYPSRGTSTHTMLVNKLRRLSSTILKKKKKNINYFDLEKNTRNKKNKFF